MSSRISFPLVVMLVLLAISVASAQELIKPVPVGGVISYKIPFNLTRLIIEPKFKYVRLKPGESTSFTVKIKNPNDKDVTIDPKVVIPPYSEMDKSWVRIDKSRFVLKSKGNATLTITVSVPKNAEKGFYSCEIAFTNDTLPYPAETPRFVNVLHLSVQVWIPPSVRIYPTSVFKYVEAGRNYIFNITVENIADRSFTLNPKLTQAEYYGPNVNYLTKDMVSIDAPSTIPPHSKVTVRIHVRIPPTAKGTLRGYVDLGINDPGLEDWAKRVSISLIVFERPTEPFVRIIRVENASVLKVEVSTGLSQFIPYVPVPYGSPFSSNADVSVRLISPHGEVKVRPKVLERFVVTLGTYGPPWESTKGLYKVMSVGKTYTYIVENPENGVWRIEIMPKNCFMFNVEVEIE